MNVENAFDKSRLESKLNQDQIFREHFLKHSADALKSVGLCLSQEAQAKFQSQLDHLAVVDPPFGASVGADKVSINI